ncbi:transcriptional regulator Kaiso-like [Lissotriton helveticus]
MEGRKLISATDTQFSSALLASLNEQRIHGLFCDVTIIVEGKRFIAHKNILSASSTYFHQLFSVANQVVQLTCVRADIFEEILNYIYSSKIVRLHSSLLEELIRSGKLLGIKFIAELGIPLSEMKSMTKGVNNNCVGISQPNLDQRGFQNKIASTEEPTKRVLSKEDGICAVPYSNEEDADDDVIFFSELLPPKPGVSNNVEVAQQRCSLDVVALSSQQINIDGSSSGNTSIVPMATPESNLHFKGVLPPGEDSSRVNIQSQSKTQASESPLAASTHHHSIPSSMLLHHHPSNSSSVYSFPQKCLSPTTDRIVLQLTSNNVASDKVVIASNDSCPSPDLLTATHGSADACDKQEFQNPKNIAVNPESSSRKEMENTDVNPGYTSDCFKGSVTGSQSIVEGKTLFTLGTPSENGGLSIGDKDYTKNEKDPCNIVVSIKDDSDDDDDGEIKLPKSTDGSPNNKRSKVKHEDHYEHVDEDGKVYYICIVCKRSYVSVKNLKRHFNIHTWEYKYPCRFCGKVFALGEYRTKHEVVHTGEKRYQCLTCGEAFTYYSSMSSHMKTAHNQDPSRDPKLYRLHKCKSSVKENTCDNKTRLSTSVPVVNDDGFIRNKGTVSDETASNLSSQTINWDDLFGDPGRQNTFKPSPSKGSAEIEFIVPESY